jgi:hypothetical protein
MGRTYQGHQAGLKTMTTTSSLSLSLQRAFEPPASGFVGIVDNLLALCREGQLEVIYHSETCHCSIRHGAVEESIEIPFRKSVFRAMLARVAALCNEQRPDSVSPYGGQGELSVGPVPVAVFLVKFVNTAEEQKLEFTHSNRINPAQPVGLDGSADGGVRREAEPNSPGG